MSLVEKLNMSFKGDRGYLHGSDFYNAIRATAFFQSSESYISDLTFRRFAKNQCFIMDIAPTDSSLVVGSFKTKLINNLDLLKEYYLVETDTKVTDRYEFDEDMLVVNAIVDTTQLTARLPKTAYTSIEEVIALTKLLNYAVAPNVSGKWVFGQLKLEKMLPEHYSELIITMKNMIKERFSINTIIIDGEVVGNIQFIVGKP